MCVQTTQSAWERPAIASDLPIIAKHFNVEGLPQIFKAMSKNGFRPLTTDIVLVAAMLSTRADTLGMQYVPFSGLSKVTDAVVKLPVMDKIVEWFENTALGTDMWEAASDVIESIYGGRVHFAMNCGCGIVAQEATHDGRWQEWMQSFNKSRWNIYGKSRVIRQETNDLIICDITIPQLTMWRRIRAALEALPAVESTKQREMRLK